MFRIFPTGPQTVYDDQKHKVAPRAWGPEASLHQSGPECLQPSPGQFFKGLTKPVGANSDVNEVRKVKSISGACRQGHKKEWWRLGSWGAHSLRDNLTLAPGNHGYMGMQPWLLSLQEQNSRFLYKISLFLQLEVYYNFNILYRAK